MDKYKLETSFQFPIFKLDEIVSYSEVKKPSGISYMTLVLINESINKDIALSEILVNFGIPENLHYIFEDEISELLRQGIIKIKYDYYDKKFFNLYKILDFSFTQKGEKIFAEECIPTGVTKEAKIPLFYDIALKKLFLEINPELEPRILKDSAITDSFMTNFKCEKDVEDFLNSNKGRKISIKENDKNIRTELIKKEEIITNVEQQNCTNWVCKYDCTLLLDEDLVNFKFENKDVEKFFYEYYSNEMINKFICFKNKFNFKSNYSEKLKFSMFNNKNLIDIIVPKSLDDVLKQKGELLITKGNYSSDSYFIIKSPRTLDLFDNHCEFITIDKNENKIAYVPGKFDFNSDLGIITIPLVLKFKVSIEEFQEIIKPYINELRSFSEDNFKMLIKITEISKDYNQSFDVLEGYLNRNSESNIVLLNEIKTIAMTNSSILNKYKELLSLNYEKYFNDLREDNLDTFLKITYNIPKFLGISSKMILDKIFQNLKEVKNKIGIFESLVKNGFNKEMVILYINPVEDVLLNKNASEESLISLIDFDEQLKKLKLLTNINDYKNYSFDEEIVNKNDFRNIYLILEKLKKNINYLREENVELFNEYEGFLQIFNKINTDFNMLDNALKNPNNIKKELIINKINSGEYQFVFVNLCAKLEIILKNNFKLKGNLYEMIRDLQITGIIDDELINDLNTFRINRNTYVHSEDRSIKFKVEDLFRWNDEIFMLEEKKDES